jgi:fumarate hydratase, class I
MNYSNLTASVYELISETSSNLPPDVRAAISAAMDEEIPGSQSALALNTIAVNVDMSVDGTAPICQDTGLPTFYIHTPTGTDQLTIDKAIEEAVERATREGKLRPNSVDSLTGRNSGNNIGPGTPAVHYEQWTHQDEVEVKLILKGGGCENKNIQYSLPTELPHLGKAGRNLDGVRKCIMHAIWQAQGQGCSIGVLGVGIGGDRTTGYEHAKKQLFRTLDDVNPIADLRKLEDYIMQSGNRLKIGTMGFGGNQTIIGCKIGALNRLPASFFVSVAYNCWAFRRLGVILDAKTGEIKRWLYKDREQDYRRLARTEGVPLTGEEIRLDTPLSEDAVRSLNVGDIVLLNGMMYTGRDALHAHLIDNDAPVDLRGAALYHCGPVMLQENDAWRVNAAGPTTSSREEPYQGDIIAKFGIRAVIGKGGMGKKTLDAMKKHGAVYLNAIGGAAQYYVRCIEDVTGVDFLDEFGVPEAMWHLRVRDFPAIVTMDAHGNSLHADVEAMSARELEEFAAPVF